MMMRYILGLFCLTLVVSGCSTTQWDQAESLYVYHQGDLCGAKERLTCAIHAEMPSGDFRESLNSVWLLLDRATVCFAEDDLTAAISDYQKAIEAMDFYHQRSFMEQMVQTIGRDDFGAYAGEDFEQILARVYFALALIQKDDLSNAYALLRQAEDLQQSIRERYRSCRETRHFHLQDNRLAKYLFALLLEKRGDVSNARVLYEQAGMTAPLTPQSSDKATVLVLCHNGSVPHKISVTTDASIASALAVETFLNCQGVPPALCMLAGIPVPALTFSPYGMPAYVEGSLDGRTQPLSTWFDVGQAAQHALDEKVPVLAARGVARMALRRSVVAVASEHSPELGMIADIAMLVANCSSEADTRSWRTLPLTIDGLRYDVDAGAHELSFSVDACGASTQQGHYALDLPPGSLCIIHVFHLHQGITQVVVPDRYLRNKGECS